MKTASIILFGAVVGMAGIFVCLYLGLFAVGSSPIWRSAVILLLLIAGAQWISFLAFRHGTALQVSFGLVLCMAVALGLIYSSHSFFWETPYPDGSNPITWRSRFVFLVLLALTQVISLLAFRCIKRMAGGGASKR